MHACLASVKMVVVLVRCSISVTKHHDQNQLGKFIFTYWPTVQFITEESQGGNLEAGTNARFAQASFLTAPRTSSQGMTPPTISWTPPHINHLLKYPTCHILWRYFSIEISSSLRTLAVPGWLKTPAQLQKLTNLTTVLEYYSSTSTPMWYSFSVLLIHTCLHQHGL